MRDNIQTILAIEDNRGMLEFIGRVLRSEGYRVMLAMDGKYGMDMFKASEPDLVLLDIKMAYPDGFFILESIRKLSNTPVIMISALWDKMSVQKTLSLGATHYIKKPFYSYELLVAIKTILQNTSNER